MILKCLNNSVMYWKAEKHNIYEVQMTFLAKKCVLIFWEVEESGFQFIGLLASYLAFTQAAKSNKTEGAWGKRFTSPSIKCSSEDKYNNKKTS